MNNPTMNCFGPTMNCYGQIHMNDVDSLAFVDWIYNRPRPWDDDIPSVLATELKVPVFKTETAPEDLVHTGGNYMSDGMGTAFSSLLVMIISGRCLALIGIGGDVSSTTNSF